MLRLSIVGIVLIAATFLHTDVGFAIESTQPVEGLHTSTTRCHAIVGVTIVTEPGKAIENGTIVVRDGVITAIGKEVVIPGDAKTWAYPAGTTVYPGFINAYTPCLTAPHREGSVAWNPLLTPEAQASELYKIESSEQEKLRNLGFASYYVAPAGRIVNGFGMLVSTGDGNLNDLLIQPKIAQHLRLTVEPHGNSSNYPASPMGAVALARQTFYDADWYEKAWRAYHTQPGLARPEHNTSLEELAKVVHEQQLVILDAPDEQYLLRADHFAREFALRAAVRGSGHEYRRLAAIRETSRMLIIPLDFPAPPDVSTPDLARDVTLEALLHWDLAPENPARLAQAGVRFAFTMEGLKSKDDFWKNLRRAIRRGLTRTQALEALTTAPAQLLGVQQQLGTLEVGKIANLTLTRGDIFEDDARILETWVSGTRYRVAAEPTSIVGGKWKLAISSSDPNKPATFWLLIEDKDDKLSGSLSLQEPVASANPTPAQDGPAASNTAAAAPTSTNVPTSTPLKLLRRDGDRIEVTFETKDLNLGAGITRMSGVLILPAESSPSVPSPAHGLELFATLIWPDGTPTTVRGQRHGDGTISPSNQTKATPSPEMDRASFEVNYPLGAFGRSASPLQPDRLALRGGTIWTCGPAGVVRRGTILIEKGRITQIWDESGERPLHDLPADTVVVDVTGKHVSPGIIDCHSHMATDGGVNEGTQAVTAEVRIGDFIDATDISIYRQLAGGVTTANVLHGSANPIGGQNQVIKLRWGELPEDMKFTSAPSGIKFALGENVKQSNWGEQFRTRYPQSRMGVEQLIRDTFHAAQDYDRRWHAWNQNHLGLPPRKDLELDAILEVLQHRRWIHCHSYRQDEILALLRTLESFQVQIGTLQHILEGYKVADEIAKHGAMASSFADWWAYKFEVIDAIPYNGAMMHNAGVVVSFNSDDHELARHLNHEAAKATKYGDVPAEEALKFVTVNPARQLRIETWVGSLESGKEADLVVWSGPPLSTFTVCEATWIDGKKYFDRNEDRQQRDRVMAMRNTLIQKAATSDEKPATPSETPPMLRELWPHEDLFCPHHHQEHP